MLTLLPFTSSDGLIVVLQEHRKLIGVTHQKISFVNALNPFYHIAMGVEEEEEVEEDGEEQAASEQGELPRVPTVSVWHFP